MIHVSVSKPPKACTVAGCDPREVKLDAVLWCPRCGEARCERHRKDLPTRSCCVNIVTFERRP